MTASLVGSNRISRRRRTVIGIMIFLYSPFSNACTGTSLAMFQMKENRWLYCAVFIRYKNNHFLRKSTPALSALCVRQSVGLWWCGPKCWLPPVRACSVPVSCVLRACIVRASCVSGSWRAVWCRLCLAVRCLAFRRTCAAATAARAASALRCASRTPQGHFLHRTVRRGRPVQQKA